MDWIDLAQDRDKRRAVVYAVMNFLISWGPYQEALYSLELVR